jgi:hypothetical protein
MHVAGAARIACQKSENDVGISVRGREDAVLPRTFDLIGLLIILTIHIIIGSLSRKGIIGHPLEPVGPMGIAGYADHGLERIHHFCRGAKLRATVRISVIKQFVSCPKAGREADMLPDHFLSIIHGLQKLEVLCLLVIYDRLLITLAEIDAMNIILRTEDLSVKEISCPWG